MAERKFQRKPDAPTKAEAVKNTPSRTCGACLMRDTQIAMVLVERGGKKFAVASHAVGERDPEVGWKVKDGWTFIRWLTYCAHCYLHQLYNAGRGVWSEVADNGIPTQDDYRRLHPASEGSGAKGDARHAGAQAKDLVGDSGGSTGASEAVADVPGPDSGPSVEGGDAIGEAVGEDEYGEALARRIGGFAGDWEVYRENAA